MTFIFLLCSFLLEFNLYSWWNVDLSVKGNFGSLLYKCVCEKRQRVCKRWKQFFLYKASMVQIHLLSLHSSETSRKNHDGPMWYRIPGFCLWTHHQRNNWQHWLWWLRQVEFTAILTQIPNVSIKNSFIENQNPTNKLFIGHSSHFNIIIFICVCMQIFCYSADSQQQPLHGCCGQ